MNVTQLEDGEEEEKARTLGCWVLGGDRELYLPANDPSGFTPPRRVRPNTEGMPFRDGSASRPRFIYTAKYHATRLLMVQRQSRTSRQNFSLELACIYARLNCN